MSRIRQVCYRVFLASPNDLQSERQIVREVIEEFSQRSTLPKVQFCSFGWENMKRGLGNAQEQILSELRKSDFVILLLGDRWGIPPGGRGHYTSGTEAEFYEAIKCCNDSMCKMRDLAVFFRAAPFRMLSDPGPQLQRVIDFRKHLEKTGEIFYGDFDELATLRSNIEIQLEGWADEIFQHRTKKAKSLVNIVQPTQAANDYENYKEPSIERAEEHLNAGRFTEAEIMFAQLTASETDLKAIIRYGLFLRNRGRFVQAIGNFNRVLELADLQRNPELKAIAYYNLAQVRRRRDELDEAEKLHMDAIQLYQAIGGSVGELGIAKQHGQLGLIFRWRGNFENAIRAHDTAAAIFAKQLCLGDQAIQHGAKGYVLQIRAEKLLAKGDFKAAQDDLECAKSLFQQSLAAVTELGKTVDIAINYGHLTRNYLIRCDFVNARKMLECCREYNRRAGDKWGLTTCNFYQGWLELRTGHRQTAQTWLSQAVESYTLMGVKRDLEDARRLLEEAITEPRS